jgi:hypothetical protein
MRLSVLLLALVLLPPQGGGAQWARNVGSSSAPVFPPGAVHVWKMEEATGATRLDSIGTAHLTQASADVQRVAGLSGYAAYSPNAGTPGSYLETSVATGGADFTLSIWAKSDPATNMYVIGGMSLAYLIGFASFDIELFDPVTGDGSVAYHDSAGDTYNRWILLVGRFNQATKTFTFRHYGAANGNGVNYDSIVASGDGWVNAFGTLYLNPFNSSGGESSKGTDEEMVMWGRLLSDAECDQLETLFYTP